MVMSGVRCRLAYGPADATAHSLSLASVKSRLVHLSGTGSPVQRAVNTHGCVCVLVVNM